MFAFGVDMCFCTANAFDPKRALLKQTVDWGSGECYFDADQGTFFRQHLDKYKYL
jgi:hypothetical protein